MTTPPTKINTPKNRMIPSIEKDSTVKKLHMETPEPAEIPQLQPTPSDPENATALELHEARLLARIEGMLQPLQIGLNNLNE